MDLCHQGDVHEAGRPEELLVVPAGVLTSEMIADRVVLPGEQVVHEAEPDPPVGGETRPLQPVLLHEQQPAVIQREPAPPVVAKAPLRLLTAAVDLRAVPPVRLCIHVRDGAVAVILLARGIAPGTPY